MKNKKIWGIIVIVAILAIGGFIALRARANSNAVAEYQTAIVGRGNLVATVGATGTVRTNQNATLSWQTSGTVAEVFVHVGDRVSAGAILATLEKTSLSQNIILAQADLVSAEKALDDLLNSNTASAQAVIALRKAEETLKKAQDYRDTLDEPYEFDEIVYKMVGTTRVPEIKTRKVDEADDETKAKANEDLALAQAQYDDAYREWLRLADGPDSTDIEAAQARIDAALATLDMAQLTAPFEGTVTLADNLSGDQVNAGTPVFRVDDMSRFLVDVELSEIDINNVSLGQNVQVTFDAILNKAYNGTVIEVGQIGNDVQGAVNFTVTIELTDADALVRPGMTAAVNIVVKEIENEILIPNRAVRLVDGERVVYLLNNGVVDMVEIRLGASAETMSVLASDNIAEGAEIILNPPSSFEMGGGPPPGMGR
jgi:HlyD family secretion protein